MLLDAKCHLCGGEAEIMALVQGEVVCFHCLAERYPELAARLVLYLTKFKGVKPG